MGRCMGETHAGQQLGLEKRACSLSVFLQDRLGMEERACMCEAAWGGSIES